MGAAGPPGPRRRGVGGGALSEGALDVRLAERGTLLDSLGGVAASWAERGRSFFAVFLDGEPALPSLYKDRR